MDNLNQDEILQRQKELDLYHFSYAIVIGVGGIGSWVAFNLALSGCIEELVLIDPDKIESSNLNRTPFRLCDVGYYKVDALKYLILERRIDLNIRTIRSKTTTTMAEELKLLIGSSNKIKYSESPDNFIDTTSFIIDCRDDVFEDFYSIPVKYYKVGYDGFGITLDGNPRKTAVWGRANGYRNVPSFICPAQLAANLIVTDILANNNLVAEDVSRLVLNDPEQFDYCGRLNSVVTFDARVLPEMLIREANKESK